LLWPLAITQYFTISVVIFVFTSSILALSLNYIIFYLMIRSTTEIITNIYKNFKQYSFTVIPALYIQCKDW